MQTEAATRHAAELKGQSLSVYSSCFQSAIFISLEIHQLHMRNPQKMEKKSLFSGSLCGPRVSIEGSSSASLVSSVSVSEFSFYKDSFFHIPNEKCNFFALPLVLVTVHFQEYGSIFSVTTSRQLWKEMFPSVSVH